MIVLVGYAQLNNRIMFSYFGGKTKIAKLYAPPLKSKIIEPFAGSARYSLLHWEKEVELYDINSTVINVWHYLQSATPKDILSLPILKVGDHIDDFNLTQPEKDLIGFELCRGKSVPRKVVSKFSNWEKARERIAKNLFKIKHWKIELTDYRDVPNQDATWFVDPPYILKDETGMNYPYGHKRLDYAELSAWCKSLRGQVIVCAGTNDAWLPFEDLRKVRNGSKEGVEKVFYFFT